MTIKFEYPPGATPLDPDETSELIPLHITTQSQLNEWEAENILKAENWLSSGSEHRNFLTINFTKKLHKKMFDATWKWAGIFRATEKNIGVTPSLITTKLKNLFEDVIYQLQHSSYSIDEVSFRFHHRLVAIHPFPNGNGRHARIMTNLLLMLTGQPRFTWGNKTLGSNGPARNEYIKALKDADKHDYNALSIFARS